MASIFAERQKGIGETEHVPQGQRGERGYGELEVWLFSNISGANKIISRRQIHYQCILQIGHILWMSAFSIETAIIAFALK